MVMENSPLVSIYIPTHNRCHLLKRAIESVFKQTYKNIELLIVDDASSDDTSCYVNSLNHPSINIYKFKQETAQGACVARNLAIKHANGEFITGLDDDDEFLPHRIADFVRHYDPRYAFICTGFLWDYGKYSRRVDSDEKTINLTQQLNYNYATNQVFVETQRLLAIDGFDESFVACQDYDTWTRLIKQFGMAKRFDGVSYVIHRGDDVERISALTNWLKGHDQFMAKHVGTMTNKNKTNQLFRRLTTRRHRLTIGQLFVQVQAGLVSQKIRYYLSSNLKTLSSIRRYFLKRKTK
jgi:glycosyltransferase involved in cell wall biosynthesis